MNTDTFMNVLTAVLVGGAVLVFTERRLRKYLEAGPAGIYHPFRIGAYFREAWGVFVRMKRVGWLLTGVYLVITVLSLLNLIRGDDSFSNEASLALAYKYRAPILDYLMNLVKFAPTSILYTQWDIAKAMEIAGTVPFIFILAYLLRKNMVSDGGVHREKASKLVFWLVVGGVFLMLVTVFQVGWGYRSHSSGDFLFEWLGILSVAATVIYYGVFFLSASLAEGVFLYMVFEAIKRRNYSVSEGFEVAIKLLFPLYIFNLAFYAAPLFFSASLKSLTNNTNYFLFILSVGQFNEMQYFSELYISGLVWLARTMLLLTPFIIMMDGSGICASAKKNLLAVFKAPVDYFTMIITVSIGAVLLSFVLSILADYVILPLSKNYILWMSARAILMDVTFIWFSLFAACVFAVFARQRFLYEDAQTETAN